MKFSEPGKPGKLGKLAKHGFLKNNYLIQV